MASREGKFPIPKFNFKVNFSKIGGDIPFQEVTGLDQEYDFLEYRSGEDADLSTRKRSGLYKSGQVSFKKGIFKDDMSVTELFDPLRIGKKDHYRANTEPMDITITLMDEAGDDMASWVVKGAVPVKMSNGDLKSDENAIAIEQIDFVFSRIDSGIPKPN